MNDLCNFPEKVTETFMLDESDKSFEKNNNSMSSSLSYIKSRSHNLNSNKHQKNDYILSKIYPKYSVNSFHNMKIGNSNVHEDLTEVTVTDIITERSDSHKSNRLMNDILRIFPQSLGLSSKSHIINHKNFIMLNTKESMSNYGNIKNNSISKESYINPKKFPLLQVEKNNYGFHKTSPIRENNFIQCNFFVTPEKIIQTKLESKSFMRNHKQFKVENNTSLSKVFHCDTVLNLENSDEINLTHKQSELNIEANIEANLTEDSTLNIVSNSDVVLHNGYTKITESSEYINRNITEEKCCKTADNTLSSKTDILNNRNRNIEIKENYNTVIGDDSVSKFEGSRNEDKQTINPTADLCFIPILPPDLLGQVHFQTGNKTKHFLAVKSIDENGWNELVNIDMLDKNKPNHSEYINNYHKDESLSTPNKASGFYKNLNETFYNIDNKISQIQNESFNLTEEFPVNKVSLNSKTHYSENKSDKSINDRYEQSQMLTAKYEKTSSFESDVLIVSDPSLSLSNTEAVNISSRSSSKMQFIPKFNMYDIGENKTENIECSSHNEKIPDQINVYPRSVKNKRRFRNDVEKSNYFHRKYNGRQLALQVLNQLGLPSPSSEIPIKIINSLTSNEMMLSALKSSQHRTLPKSNCCLKPECYKKTPQKPYLEKVRLQRPEITRRMNFKPFTYSKNLATLKPKKNYHKYFKNPKKVSLETFDSQNDISQGTDKDSIFSDWSVPQKVNLILNEKSKLDINGCNTEELSQVISIQSNSVIDWDQVSEMIKSPTLK